MIEYRTLKQNGHCSLCGCGIKKDIDKTTVVTFYHRSLCPTVNICRECAYDIFYAPAMANASDPIKTNENHGE